MKQLIPYTIGEAEVESISTAITETPYSSSETVNKGDRRYVGRYLYEAAKNGINSDPETNAGGVSISKDWTAEYEAVEDPDWLVVGMINKWRCLDSYVTTVTEVDEMIEVVLLKPYVDSLYFLNVFASALHVQVLSASDTVLWSKILDLRGNDEVLDEWEWCWKPIPAPASDVKVDFGFITGAADKIRIVGYGH